MKKLNIYFIHSDISNYNDLTVRTASVSIPQRMQSSYTQKILNLMFFLIIHRNKLHFWNHVLYL